MLKPFFEAQLHPFLCLALLLPALLPAQDAPPGLGSISCDEGKTFRNLGAMHSDIHDIVFSINDSERMFCGTDGGVYRSWNGGTTMEIVENLPVSQFYHVSVDNQEPYNIYGGLDNNTWYRPSSSPGGIESRDWQLIGVGDGFSALAHPTKRIVYSEMLGAENVWRTDLEKNKIRIIQPQVAKGQTISREGATPALIPAGKCKIVVQKGTWVS